MTSEEVYGAAGSLVYKMGSSEFMSMKCVYIRKKEPVTVKSRPMYKLVNVMAYIH